MKRRAITLLAAAALAAGVAVAATVPTAGAQRVVQASVPELMGIGKVKVKSAVADAARKRVTIDLNEAYGDVPFTKQTVAAMAEEVKSQLGAAYSGYEVVFTIEGRDIATYLPEAAVVERDASEFITPLDADRVYTKGLSGDIIAMWQSHGWYFEPKLNRWEWQRGRMLQTVEDVYTQSYVVPFLAPMLENAGAYVMLPRERDTHSIEYVIDGDGGNAVGIYSEHNGHNHWQRGDEPGFAYKRDEYRVGENPFAEGSYRRVAATADASRASRAVWSHAIEEDGDYAVYVSYHSLPHSATDAVYTVHHAGGDSKFKVNQTMGGGTWIYLGTFPLRKGYSGAIVELSNVSADDDAVITADAVKIGGGMGNVARKVKTEDNPDARADIDYEYKTSLRPRFVEGARYWLQWAGVPDSVYTPSDNLNDYTDDYKCRGEWVNYLLGGSRFNEERPGLRIPVDLSLAFHSDAGVTGDDSIVGTLGIYYDKGERQSYPDGSPRTVSRHYTDLVMSNIVADVRRGYEPRWSRRGMWNKTYFEARVPEVPAMLLELLSHQNFADMRLGLNPEFRFTVSRAIYKGMLQFLAEREGRDYQVQPLPVHGFGITNVGSGSYRLEWKATPDSLTANADASAFIVEERIDGEGFAPIAKVTEPSYTVNVTDDRIHSYRIVALNDGGRSFPSETLALRRAASGKEVLIVNGFTRVSAPDWYDNGAEAGFLDAKDHGVPYGEQINYVGAQKEFRRALPWVDDDATGYGDSRSNYDASVIAGNTFDYPYLHGTALAAAGYGFISCSVEAYADGGYEGCKLIDFIFGKQKEVKTGRSAVPNRHKLFTPALCAAIERSLKAGASIFLSGAYIATDTWDNVTRSTNIAEAKFVEKSLGYKYLTGQAATVGDIYVTESPAKQLKAGSHYNYNDHHSRDIYTVESPDGIVPADKNGFTFARYAENNIPCGVVSERATGSRVCALGVPFETITDAAQRSALMKQIINYLSRQ